MPSGWGSTAYSYSTTFGRWVGPIDLLSSAMPLLGSVAAVTERVKVGSLVARIGLLPDAILVASLKSLDLLSNGRFVAGLGVGDHLSAQENLAYGIRYAPSAERLESLKECATRLLEDDVTVWIGGRARTIEIARDVGAVANLWGAGRDELAAVRNDYGIEVTWAGTAGRYSDEPLEPSVDATADHLTEVGVAGATWAVCTWPAPGSSPEQLAEVAGEVRRRLAAS